MSPILVQRSMYRKCGGSSCHNLPWFKNSKHPIRKLAHVRHIRYPKFMLTPFSRAEAESRRGTYMRIYRSEGVPKRCRYQTILTLCTKPKPELSSTFYIAPSRRLRGATEDCLFRCIGNGCCFPTSSKQRWT